MSQKQAVLVRVIPEVKAWLACRAADNGRTLNAEVNQILKALISAEPLYAVVRKCTHGSEVFFTAALGESTDDFYVAPKQEHTKQRGRS